ncbi:MAG: hypothetical protein GY898_34380 [Proteobacteria bacterium]|nr:hypothetical protein [Pseudomonadota bacterium]
MDRVKVHLKRAAIGFVVAFVVLQAGFWWMVRLPAPDVDVPVLPAPIIDGDRISRPGGGFLERRDGYWFFLHRGDAVTLGAEHAQLGEFLIQRTEDLMFAEFDESMPALAKVFVPPYLLWKYRAMPGQIPVHQQEELWGFSASYADRHSFPLSAYRRGIYYHALHDMIQSLVDSPHVADHVDASQAGACTAFAASGESSEGGRLIAGRNFDFEVFPTFDADKVVHLYVRDGAIPVLSVTWMAMAGVVTGMNADGIWISINAAATEGRNTQGPPVSLWIRDILEQARSIEDVRRLMRASDPIVSDIYLVGDGTTGEAVVIERGQTRMGERSMDAKGRIVAANHMLTPEFAGDTDDANLRQRSSTMSRHMRMRELVDMAPLSPSRGVEILRDKKAPGGEALVPGNRNAIDAVIATHSAVADVTDRLLWVSIAPHTVGRYERIDLLAELDAAGIDTEEWRAGLAEGARAWEHSDDPEAGPPTEFYFDHTFLSDLGDLERQRSYLGDAKAYLGNGEAAKALDMAHRADAALPGAPGPALMKADACVALEDEACATEAYTEYLQRIPGLGLGTKRATAWLEKRGAVPTVKRPDGL